MRYLRIAGKALVALLAVIGGLAVLAYAVPWIVQKTPGDVRPQHIALRASSPDGLLKVAVLGFFGGGGIAPYCYDVLSVVPAEASDQEIIDRRFEIFSGPCASFAPKDNIVTPSPQIEWLSDTELKITFSINETAVYPKKVSLKKKDASGRVRLQFVAHE